VLVDTNIFLRVKQPSSIHHAQCIAALDKLRGGTEPAHTCAQVWIEYWAVLTRPLANNGLGFAPELADADMDGIQTWFPVLPEPPDIAARWRDIVRRYGVSGRQGHDARIVAVMLAHGIENLVTLNGADFARYAGITVLTPADIASPPAAAPPVE
jgi:predicted nucleic acid-binding protein